LHGAEFFTNIYISIPQIETQIYWFAAAAAIFVRVLLRPVKEETMKVLLFMAKGVETMEASVFIDVFGWSRSELQSDIEVITCGMSKEVISTFNIPFTVDVLLDQVTADDYDALAIPGGFEEYGFYEDAYDERFLQLIREFDRQEKWIASICVGALPIGKSGVLQGRSATTYQSDDGARQKQLQAFDVHVMNEPIVIDKNVITSYNPASAAHVAFILLEKMSSRETAQEIKRLMGF